jgi:hypothetical protein
MFYVEIFLLLIFTVLCGILVALWSIRSHLERISGGGSLGAGSTPVASAAKPPAA